MLAPTVAADGSFTFTFSNPSNLVTGNFKVEAVATYGGQQPTTTTSVYVQIRQHHAGRRNQSPARPRW